MSHLSCCIPQISSGKMSRLHGGLQVNIDDFVWVKKGRMTRKPLYVFSDDENLGLYNILYIVNTDNFDLLDMPDPFSFLLIF